MHVECSSCHARYVIADDKIPVQGARVRCRKCQSVFSVERPASAPAPTELPLIPPTPQSPIESTPSPFSSPPSAAPSAFTSSSAESNPFGPPPEPTGPSQVAPTQVERFSFRPPAAALHAPAPSAAAPPARTAPQWPPPVESVSPFSASAGIPAGLP